MKLLQKNPIPILIISFALLLFFRESFPSLLNKIQILYIALLKDALLFLGSQTFDKIGGSELSLKLHMFVIISVIILPYSWKQKIWLVLACLAIVFSINVLRIYLFFKDANAGGLFYEQNSFIIFHLTISILIFILWSFVLSRNKGLSISAIRSNLQASEKYGLGYKFVFAFLLLYFFRFIIQFFPNITNNIYTLLVDVILNLSKHILHLFNYPAQITGNKIYDSHTEIIMRFPCIGINLLMIYLLFIFITQGSKGLKLFYSTFGLTVLILVNAVRVSLLYAFLYNGIPSVAKIDWHDLFNMLVYLSIFFLWMSWISMQKAEQN